MFQIIFCYYSANSGDHFTNALHIAEIAKHGPGLYKNFIGPTQPIIKSKNSAWPWFNLISTKHIDISEATLSQN